MRQRWDRRLGAVWVCGIAIFLAGCQHPAKETAGVGASDIEITDVSIVNLENGAISSHRDVLVQDGSITAIRDTGPQAESRATLIDGRGKFLMPGMWDMHTHITHPEVDFPVYLANGVLGIRSMGGNRIRFLRGMQS